MISSLIVDVILIFSSQIPKICSSSTLRKRLLRSNRWTAQAIAWSLAQKTAHIENSLWGWRILVWCIEMRRVALLAAWRGFDDSVKMMPITFVPQIKSVYTTSLRPPYNLSSIDLLFRSIPKWLAYLIFSKPSTACWDSPIRWSYRHGRTTTLENSQFGMRPKRFVTLCYQTKSRAKLMWASSDLRVLWTNLSELANGTWIQEMVLSMDPRSAVPVVHRSSFILCIAYSSLLTSSDWYYHIRRPETQASMRNHSTRLSTPGTL